jgi:hypothetical protein
MQTSLARLAERLDPSRVRRSEPLAPYTTFRIGGPADVFYTATSADDLATTVTAARDADVPFFILGLGANILVGDKGFRGLVIRNAAEAFRFDGNRGWSTTSEFRALSAGPSGRICTSSHPHPSASARCSSRKCSNRVSCFPLRVSGERSIVRS